MSTMNFDNLMEIVPNKSLSLSLSVSPKSKIIGLRVVLWDASVQSAAQGRCKSRIQRTLRYSVTAADFEGLESWRGQGDFRLRPLHVRLIEHLSM